MKVGIIGSGGREHAMCQTLSNSNKIKKIYCFPGNAGTTEIASNISLNLENFNELKDFIILNKYQKSSEYYEKYSDYVISNNGTIEILQTRFNKLYSKFKK